VTLRFTRGNSSSSTEACAAGSCSEESVKMVKAPERVATFEILVLCKQHAKIVGKEKIRETMPI
jgi:hypothetical protein